MFKNLWKRTKHVASTYTGTFIVVMLLNQLLFFGFCLNPICLVAAMPHVLLITVVVGSWINKMGNWGADKSIDAATLQAEPTETSPLQDTFSAGNRTVAVMLGSGSEALNRKATALNISVSAKSHYSSERFYVDAQVSISECQLETDAKLAANPSLKAMYDEISPEFEPEGRGVDVPVQERKKLGVFEIAEVFPKKEISDAIKDDVARLTREHTRFLKSVKMKLLKQPELQPVLEVAMTQSGGKAIFDYIMAIDIPSLDQKVRGTPIHGLDVPSARVKPIVAPTIQSRKIIPRRPLSRSSLSNRALIRAQVEALGIPHLVHFTRCENLPSILRHGLLSVTDCAALGVQEIRNDPLRLDTNLDGISLSVSCPNYRMFYKQRQNDPTADWAILLLSTSILWDKRCGFYRHNAADARMRNLPRSEVTHSDALGAMFGSKEQEREDWLLAYDPTDPQAEIMAFDPIEPSFINTIVFETKKACQGWQHVMGGIDTIYAGHGNGLFASRKRIRQN
jgi:hypothetical protein